MRFHDGTVNEALERCDAPELEKLLRIAGLPCEFHIAMQHKGS